MAEEGIMINKVSESDKTPVTAKEPTLKEQIKDLQSRLAKLEEIVTEDTITLKGQDCGITLTAKNPEAQGLWVNNANYVAGFMTTPGFAGTLIYQVKDRETQLVDGGAASAFIHNGYEGKTSIQFINAQGHTDSQMFGE